MRRIPPLAIGIALLAGPLAAQARIELAPSTRGTTTVTEMTAEGVTPRTIKLDWGQPHLRGRSLHTDSLVPFGQVWRTGANATTTLHTDFALMLGGTRLEAGDYALFTLPTPEGWQLIVQNDVGQSIAEYEIRYDVARIPLHRRTLRAPVESLSMWLIPARGAARGELRMAWGTAELSTEWQLQ